MSILVQLVKVEGHIKSLLPAYPIKKEAHRGVLDGEKVSKFIDEPSRLRVGNPKVPLVNVMITIIAKVSNILVNN